MGIKEYNMKQNCEVFLKNELSVTRKNTLCKVLSDYTRKIGAGLYEY